MHKRLAPVVAFAVTTGALTYLFSGAWVSVAWFSNRESVTEHKSIYSQYWTEPPWIIAACLVMCTVLVVTSSAPDRAIAAWRRWLLWGLLPSGVYILTLAILVPVFRTGVPDDAIYVVLWAAIDGSLWVTMLAPLLARALVRNITVWKPHFEDSSPEPRDNEDNGTAARIGDI